MPVEPEAQVTDGFEVAALGAGIPSQIIWRGSEHSQLLGHLSSLNLSLVDSLKKYLYFLDGLTTESRKTAKTALRRLFLRMRTLLRGTSCYRLAKNLACSEKQAHVCCSQQGCRGGSIQAQLHLRGP